jgi:murein DD-endopeptidase MepM/ murein hydrolase activator NlpD
MINSNSKLNKSQNLKAFMKKNAYYLIIAGVVIATAIAIALATLLPKKSTPVITPPLEATMPMQNAKVVKGYSEMPQFNQTLGNWSGFKAVSFTAENLDVSSILPGTVISITSTYLEGTKITIEHDGGFVSVYTSLDKTVDVSEGQKVEGGQKIGKASTSAQAEYKDGDHVTLQLLKNNAIVDPGTVLDLGDK